MYLNCYDGYGLCLFAVHVKDGVDPENLGDHLYYEHDLVDSWSASERPDGAVVRF